MGHKVWQSSNDQVPASTMECGQPLAQQGLHHPPSSYTHSLDQTAQVYQEHGIQTTTSFQMSAPEHDVEHAHMRPVIPQVSNMGSIYGHPYDTSMTPLAYQQQQQQQDSTWKNFHDGFAYERLDVHHMGALSSGNSDHVSTGMSSHCRHDLMHLEAHADNSISSPSHSPPSIPELSVQVYHHHRLLDRSLQSTTDWSVSEHGVTAVGKRDPPSVVGQPGMPQPAAKPMGPKIKFSQEDDVLLVRLKETKNLTWKQIADFFPGRSSGTLQVRYCTKLKAKRMVWTEDMVGRCSFLEVAVAC
jgi:hypothetical protein